jgi:hypothetical protein
MSLARPRSTGAGSSSALFRAMSHQAGDPPEADTMDVRPWA